MQVNLVLAGVVLLHRGGDLLRLNHLVVGILLQIVALKLRICSWDHRQGFMLSILLAVDPIAWLFTQKVGRDHPISIIVGRGYRILVYRIGNDLPMVILFIEQWPPIIG